MPLLKLQTNQTVEDGQALCRALTSKVSEILSKPEDYVMIAVEDRKTMTFAGTGEPTAFFDVSTLGTISSEQAKRFSAEISQILQDQLGVPPARVFSQFIGWQQRELWGFNGQTFG